MSNAEPFTRMAERIDRNETDFGGGAVIVPPTGEPIEILFLDPAADEAQFWGAVQARVAMMIAGLDTRQRQGR